MGNASTNESDQSASRDTSSSSTSSSPSPPPLAAVLTASSDNGTLSSVQQFRPVSTIAGHVETADEIITTWECVTRLAVQWSDATITISFVALGLINVMVVVGNTLVIMAVFLSEKLRTVTNLFIVSLAVSDLLVGLAVLPFSTANEVLGVWIFGAIWCEVWLAVDVWMCTASILNLCAISLDRYVAVTRPVSYPNIMSPKRAKVLIALVWCVSFVICFPPLVGWNDSRQHGGTYLSSTLYAPVAVKPSRERSRETSIASPLSNSNPTTRTTTTTTTTTTSVRKPSDSIDYVEDVANKSSRREASSTPNESFDDFVALEFNLSDLAVAARNDVLSDISHQQQQQQQEDEEDLEDDDDDHSVPVSNVSVLCQCQLISDKGYRIYSAIGSFYLPMFVMLFFYWRIYKAAVKTTRAINQGFRTTSSKSLGGRFEEQRMTLRIHRGRSSNDLFAKTNGAGESNASTKKMHSTDSGVSFRDGCRKVRNSSMRESSTRVQQDGGMTFPPSGERKAGFHRGSRHNRSAGAADNPSLESGSVQKAPRLLNSSRRKAFRRHFKEVNESNCRPPTSAICSMTTSTSTMTGACSSLVESNVDELYDRRAAAAAVTGVVGIPIFSKMGKRNIKAQVKRFRTEKKAAKTLGIIVGGFILCWMPFFTIYLVGAFCEDSDCIPESLFAVAFWLGYCNSAINPCVYALFSRDFRNAFKRILCRCFMRRDHNVKKRIVTMFPATFHLASFFEESEDGVSNSR